MKSIAPGTFPYPKISKIRTQMAGSWSAHLYLGVHPSVVHVSVVLGKLSLLRGSNRVSSEGVEDEESVWRSFGRPG